MPTGFIITTRYCRYQNDIYQIEYAAVDYYFFVRCQFRRALLLTPYDTPCRLLRYAMPFLLPPLLFHVDALLIFCYAAADAADY